MESLFGMRTWTRQWHTHVVTRHCGGPPLQQGMLHMMSATNAWLLWHTKCSHDISKYMSFTHAFHLCHAILQAEIVDVPITASWALLGKFAMHLPRGCWHHGQPSARIPLDHVLGQALHDWSLEFLILSCYFSYCYEAHTRVKELLKLCTIGSHTLAYGF